MIWGLEDEVERMKYKNYGDQSSDKIDKYAPKVTRYTSGKGINREFGVAVRSAEGETLYKNTKDVWVATLKDIDTCNQIMMRWKQWTNDNDFCRAWGTKTTKIGKRSEEEEHEGDDVDEDPGVVDICSLGEDEYVNIWGEDSALNENLGRDFEKSRG